LVFGLVWVRSEAANSLTCYVCSAAPVQRGVLLRLTCDVFTGAKMRLDVGFNATQVRLANLAHGPRSRFP